MTSGWALGLRNLMFDLSIRLIRPADPLPEKYWIDRCYQLNVTRPTSRIDIGNKAFQF